MWSTGGSPKKSATFLYPDGHEKPHGSEVCLTLTALSNPDGSTNFWGMVWMPRMWLPWVIHYQWYRVNQSHETWKIPNALLKRGINRYKDEGSTNPIATWWDWGDWWQLLVSGSDSKQVSTSIFGVPMGPRSLGRDRWDLGPWDKKPSGRRHPAGVQSFSYSGTM